ncbi:DUF2955 domain-containing protein [Halodesulfovibrio aestuarii]|nr:DUF2955 domain-containing protein [Halodesulfovibrio aestuarii]
MFEIIRKTLIIALCLVLSKVLHLQVGIFLVLYGIIIANNCPVNRLPVMLRILAPSFLAAVGASFVNQIFSAHPFIIWTLSVVYFDHIRKKTDTSVKARSAIFPLFNVIFIDTFANSSDFVLVVPDLIRDLLVSIFLASAIAYLVNLLLPIKLKKIQTPVVTLPVSGAERLKILILVGGGLAFLMLNEVTSATFCLVPVITSVMQPTYGHMKKEVEKRIITQVGGCCSAMFLSILFMGTEINVATFFLVSFGLVFTLMKWCECPDPVERSIHNDAVLGILVPFQLYIGKYGNNFGLDLIALRTVELVLALGVVYCVAIMLGKNQLART